MQFKRQLSHLAGQDSVCAPSIHWWQWQPDPSYILTLQTFWHPASVTSWKKFRVVEGVSPEGCGRSLWQILLAQDPPRLQSASCSGLWQWRGRASSLQESLHQQMCQLLCISFPTSSSYPLLCMVALTGVTVTMWVLCTWSCIWEGLWDKHHCCGAGSMQECC